jgi:hypothetical protein
VWQMPTVDDDERFFTSFLWKSLEADMSGPLIDQVLSFCVVAASFETGAFAQVRIIYCS